MNTPEPDNTDQPVETLIRFLDRWQPHKIIVAGDFMLDRYVYGNADRLSPDAPVPVMAAQRSEFLPGGASNVCLDLRALRADVVCLGIVGQDESADRLREALQEAGCDPTGLITSPDRPTTVKHNFIGLAQHRHPQKMFRVDDESRQPIPPDAADQLLELARATLPGASALCLEDYAKGVLTEPVCQSLIAMARDAGIPVLVDPAAISDYSRYRGATCITPNRTEAALATKPTLPTPGHNESEDLSPELMARVLLDSLALEAVVLTLDKQGALLLERDKPPQLVPTQARSVYDVSGAGDVVLAMLAAATANKADWHTAVGLANAAAGLEVERFGVVPIPLDDVLLNLLQSHHSQLGKLRSLDQLLPELAAYRKQGKSVAFTNGCFDILHAGHVQFLRSARRAGDLLVVAINSDDSIRRLKGPDRPVNHEDDRVMVLSELESVDYIVTFNADTPVDLLEAIQPDVLVKGGDYTREEVVGGDLVESHGGRVELVTLVQGRSTTNIIRKITTGT